MNLKTLSVLLLFMILLTPFGASHFNTKHKQTLSDSSGVILNKTLNKTSYEEKSKNIYSNTKPVQITPRFTSTRAHVWKGLIQSKAVATKKVNNRVRKHNTINISNHLRVLQIKLDDMALRKIEEHGSDRFVGNNSSSSSDIESKTQYKFPSAFNIKNSQLEFASTNIIEKTNNADKNSSTGSKEYWKTVHSIESKQGKLLYRPKNKARNCTYTSGPCGHYQLTVQALNDIGCNSLQCRKDRLNYKKSLKLSKKLLALNEKRLRKDGILNLEDYQKYLIHQQGANGIKNILAASKGSKILSKNIKKNIF